MTIITVADESEVVRKLSSYIERISNNAISSRGNFFIGLSGGSVLKYLCEGLPHVDTDWSKWTVAFCDERLVPESSDESTFGAYKRQLLPACQLQESQFVVIKHGVTASEAAVDYATKLKFVFNGEELKFDLLVLGMGPDGHTCSLFPGHSLLEVTDVPVAALTDSPKPPPERITLTYPVINNARNCIFAISGAGKAETVKKILRDEEDLPAGRVCPSNGALYWILDKAAAALL